MLQLTINGGWQQFVKPLRDKTDFRTYGNLRGAAGPATSYGKLPQTLRHYAAQADYVVYSYETPIAWHVPGMRYWYSPGISYSVSTTKAQGRIFAALAQLDSETPHEDDSY